VYISGAEHWKFAQFSVVDKVSKLRRRSSNRPGKSRLKNLVGIVEVLHERFGGESGTQLVEGGLQNSIPHWKSESLRVFTSRLFCDLLDITSWKATRKVGQLIRALILSSLRDLRLGEYRQTGNLLHTASNASRCREPFLLLNASGRCE
jgi:hypothetical protein